MTLPDLWFVIIAVLWTGFFVLEGFDFGVGVLHGVVGRTENERRVAINTIGPFWDGNEVWLIVGGAAIFAAFPSWYATWFSAGYLALVLILAALIARGVSFEFRGKVDTPRWRHTWSTTLTVGSLLAPLLIGVALGDLLAGLPVDADEEFTGSFLDLLTPFGLLTGLTLLLLCLLHGASFLALRTTGDLRDRALRLGRVLAIVALVAGVAYGVSMAVMVDVGPVTTVALVLVPLGVLLASVALGRRDGLAFCATATAIGLTVVAMAVTASAPRRTPRLEKRCDMISPMVGLSEGLVPGPAFSSRRLVRNGFDTSCCIVVVLSLAEGAGLDRLEHSPSFGA